MLLFVDHLNSESAELKYLHKHFSDIFNKSKIHDLFCILSTIEAINFENINLFCFN